MAILRSLSHSFGLLRRAGAGLLCAGILAAQPARLPASHAKAVDALVGFFAKFGAPGEAEKVKQDFQNGKIVIAPVPENDNADTDADTKVITLNPKLAGEITKATGEDFKSTADWAATIRHEYQHAAQTTGFVMRSNARRMITGGCPHEVEGWRAGFQSLMDWMAASYNRMRTAGSEAERESAAQQLRDLTKSFEEYQQNYPKSYGEVRLTSRDGWPVSLDDALKEAGELRKASDAVLERLDFTVTTQPRVLFPKAGETFTVKAYPRGGANDKAGSDDAHRQRIYTFAWFADGTALGETGLSLNRTAAKSEKISVVATDSLSRKREAVCVVTVAEAPGNPPKPKETAPPAGSCPLPGVNDLRVSWFQKADGGPLGGWDIYPHKRLVIAQDDLRWNGTSFIRTFHSTAQWDLHPGGAWPGSSQTDLVVQGVVDAAGTRLVSLKATYRYEQKLYKTNSTAILETLTRDQHEVELRDFPLKRTGSPANPEWLAALEGPALQGHIVRWREWGLRHENITGGGKPEPYENSSATGAVKATVRFVYDPVHKAVTGKSR